MIAAFTGLVAGAVHVWSGPDHLAAVAPLAVRCRKQGWIPGARWGLGHSAGVALVGLFSLWLRELLPVDLLSSWSERLVGVMLFGIGLWALRKTFKNTVHVHEHEHDGDRHVHFHTHMHHGDHEEAKAHHHTHAAFGIGMLHGLAGSSHVFGVLPILAFETRAQAVAYLAAYAAGTIASMAAFSWVMGRVATRWAECSVRCYRGLMTSCAITAMAVGVFWMTTSFR